MVCLWSDPLGVNCWISVAPALVLILLHVCVESWFIYLLIWCIDATPSMIKRPSRGPNNVCVYEPHQNQGRSLWPCETGLSSPQSPHQRPSNLKLTVWRRCFCCGLFYLPVFVHFFSTLDVLFILFRIAWWPSVGKSVSRCLSAFAVLLDTVWIVCVFVFVSRLVPGAGCGIRLYRFLIIAFSFIFF